MVSNSQAFRLIDGTENITDYLAESAPAHLESLQVVIEMSMGAACASRKGNLLLFSVLEGYSPQAALLACDAIAAGSHRNHTGNDAEDGDDSDSDSDEEEDGDERSPMTALLQAPTDWILSTCLYRA
jgi:hypothetical protein